MDKLAIRLATQARRYRSIVSPGGTRVHFRKFTKSVTKTSLKQLGTPLYLGFYRLFLTISRQKPRPRGVLNAVPPRD